jgi:citrate synthase
MIVRLIAKMPTLVALAHRRVIGSLSAYLDKEIHYGCRRGIVLRMTSPITDRDHGARPVLEEGLRTPFTPHAKREQDRSPNAVRLVGPSRVDRRRARPPVARPQRPRS